MTRPWSSLNWYEPGDSGMVPAGGRWITDSTLRPGLLVAADRQHAIERQPGRSDDVLGHRHLVLAVGEGIADVRQRDPLHVRAEVARPDVLDLRMIDDEVVGHRALGDERDALGIVLGDV